MAGAAITMLLLALAGLAIRKQLKKGAWTKSCPGCAGHSCGGGCGCGCNGEKN